MAARQTVKTRVRLYDTDPVTGFKFLAYPQGATVPLSDFERLIRSNPKAVGSAKQKPRPEPAEAPPAPSPLYAEMGRGQLMVLARTRGFAFTTRVTKAELVELLEKAES